MKIPSAGKAINALFAGRMSLFCLVALFLPVRLPALPEYPFYRLQGSDILYEMSAGENLHGLARKHGLGRVHLRRANARPGKSGKVFLPLRRAVPAVYHGSGAVVNLPERMVYVFSRGSLKAFYPLAIGMSPARWQTPVGSYRVAVKVKNPTWYPPDWAGIEGPVPPGSGNPLGDRWIGLSRRGYGFHGTPLLTSIGEAASHGCMRMYPESLHELYNLLDRGAAVEIVYRPILLAEDREECQYYLSVFPDVYGQVGNMYGYARRMLKQAHIEDLVDEERLRSIVRQARGVPEPLLGDNRTLYLNGRRVNTRFPVLAAGKGVYLSAQDMPLLLYPWSCLHPVGSRRLDRGAVFSENEYRLIMGRAYVALEGWLTKIVTSANSVILYP